MVTGASIREVSVVPVMMVPPAMMPVVDEVEGTSMGMDSVRRVAEVWTRDGGLGPASSYYTHSIVIWHAMRSAAPACLPEPRRYAVMLTANDSRAERIRGSGPVGAIFLETYDTRSGGASSQSNGRLLTLCNGCTGILHVRWWHMPATDLILFHRAP